MSWVLITMYGSVILHFFVPFEETLSTGGTVRRDMSKRDISTGKYELAEKRLCGVCPCLSRDKYLVYRLWFSRTENKTRWYFSGARILLPMPPPKHVPFRVGQVVEEGTPRVSRKLRGARTPRTRSQKGADSGPRPEEHPPYEPAKFRLPAPKNSRKFEISYQAP